MRVQPRTGRVRPYAEGLAGFSHAHTSTGPLWTTTPGRRPRISATSGPTSGTASGVTVSEPEAELSLSLGLRYRTGGDVSYLTKGASHRDEYGATIEPARSPLSLVSTQIGMAFDFQ